jgi:hypothetical protein
VPVLTPTCREEIAGSRFPSAVDRETGRGASDESADGRTGCNVAGCGARLTEQSDPWLEYGRVGIVQQSAARANTASVAPPGADSVAAKAEPIDGPAWPPIPSASRGWHHGEDCLAPARRDDLCAALEMLRVSEWSRIDAARAIPDGCRLAWGLFASALAQRGTSSQLSDGSEIDVHF